MAHPSRFSASRRFSPRSRLLAAAVAGCFVSAPAFTQLPTNPTVVSGSATFSQTANVLTVTNSNGTIINWDTFSIGAGKTTYFQQASASSAVLNRVVTADPSQIYGTLASNGKVWLVNPAGIMVGAGGVVDTAGFVGSTLRVGDADFLAGRLNFQTTPGAGSFVNQGTITTPSGGSVYLIAAAVANEGTIATPGGETILAAGETVNLIDTATPGVKVEVTGTEGNVTNLGTVLADAGRIGMAGVIVRNSGTLNASSVVNEGGRIFLKASKDTYVDGAGRIVATGTKGGRVEVLGDRVAVMDQASIDASGTNGGGTILVGGDYQGKNPDIQNAQVTYFGREAMLKADAVENGDGGRIIVWADDTTRVYGNISARGGAQSGNGGFVETSGHRYLQYDATTDLRATHGSYGTLLLDPNDLTIHDCCSDNLNSQAFSGGVFDNATGSSNMQWSTLSAQLATGNVRLQTGPGGTGNISFTTYNPNVSFSYGGTTSLTLWAYGGGGSTGNISFSSSNLFSLTLGGDLNMIAGWDGNTSTPGTVSGTGDISFSNVKVQAAGITATAGKDIKFDASSGPVSVYATGAMTLTGTNILAYGSTTASAYGGASTNYYGNGVLVTAGGNQVINADTSSGTIALYGGSVKNDIYGGQLAYGGSVIFKSQSGNQTIKANRILLQAGASGHDNAAVLEAYGSQNITVYAGGIALYGGGSTGSYNNFAGIQQNNSASGSQTITTYGGNIYMAGGAGTGTGGFYDSSCGSACAAVASHNKASIRNGFGNQTIDFYYGGNLTLVGGSGGNGNEAMINNESTGAQKIWSSYGAGAGGTSYMPVISITGGSSGGTMVYGSDSKYHHVDNSAGISAGSDTAGTGTQEVLAKGITLTASGGSSTYGGAYLGAYGSATITSYGNVVMTGGGGSRTTEESFTTAAGIGSDKTGNVTLSVYGNLTMTGGTGTGGGALIGSLTYGSTVSVNAYGGDITLTGGKGAVMIGSAAKTATTDQTNITVAASGNITATASSDTSGYGDIWIGSYGGPLGTTVEVRAGGNLTTSGPAKNVYIGTYGSAVTTMYLSAGYDMTGSAASSTGGNLTLGSGTYVRNASSIALRAEKGSTGAGSASIAGSVTGTGLVGVTSYGSTTVSGSVYGGNGVDIKTGYSAIGSAASASGGDLTLTATSKVDGQGANGVRMQALGTSSGATGSFTQQAGSTVYGSTSGSNAVVVYGGGDMTIDGAMTAYGTYMTIGAGWGNAGLSGYGGNISLGAASALRNEAAAGNLLIYADDGSRSAGTITQTSGGVTYGGSAVGITSASNMSLAGSNTAQAGSLTLKAGVDGAGSASAYGGNLSMSGTARGSTGVGYYAYGGTQSNGNLTATGTTTLTGTGIVYGYGYGNVTVGTIALDTASQSVFLKSGYDSAAGAFRNVAQSTEIGSITAPSGTVNIAATGAILEPTGEASGTKNITAQNVTLTSTYGGALGGKAISTDVADANNITATVSTDATYGGIRIGSSATSTAPSAVVLNDGAGYKPSSTISFSYGGDLTLAGGGTALTANAYGDIAISATGNMTVTSPTISTTYTASYGSVLMSASKDLTYNGGTFPNTSLGLAAGGILDVNSTLTTSAGNIVLAGSTVKIDGAVSQTGTGNIAIAAGTLDMTSNVKAYGGNVGIVAGNMVAYGSNAYVSASNDLIGAIASNARLNNGAYLYAGNDVKLTFAGADSTLYLNDTAGAANPSYILAGSPSTIKLAFSARSTGGIVIDGVPSTTSVAGGSGLFVTNTSTPATAGAGLELAFGVTAPPAVVTEVVNTINSSTSSTTSTTSSTTQTSDVPPPPPPPATGGGTTLPTLGNQTIGGGTDQFGGTSSSGGGTTGGTTGTSSGTTGGTGTTTGTSTGGTGSSDSGTKSDSGSGTSSGDGSKSSSGDGSKSASSDKDGANGKGDKKDEKKEDKKDDKKDDKKSADSGDKKDDKSSGKKPVGKCSA